MTPTTDQPTDFQKQVWDLVRRIPEGRVTTYGAIANALSSHPRAVGTAISGIPNDMPWWRVLKAGWIIPEKPKELYLARIALLENEGFREGHLQVPHNRSWSP